MFHKFVLPNGLSVVLVPQKAAKTLTALVGVRVGSRMETERLNGLSHFMEHMMFKGTQKRPSTFLISKELDTIGAQYNAFTSKDMTAYYIKASSKHETILLDMLSDMLCHSLLDPAEIERERGVILEEIKMYEENPLMYIDDLLEAKMYEGNTLGSLIIGTRENIRKNIVHEDFVHFKKSYYRGENMCLVLAGDIQKDMRHRVAEYFAPLHGEKKRNQPRFKSFESQQKNPKVTLFYKDLDQVQLGMGFVAYADDHPDKNALQLLATILGGNMSSKLFIEVRERRGLAYFVKASLNPYQDVGNFSIQIGLDKNKVKETIEVVMGELEKITLEGVMEEELENAKSFIAGHMDLQLEDSSNLAQWYFRQELLLGTKVTPEERLEEMKKVTKHDIVRVAQDIFQSKKMTLALIGPFKSESQFTDILSV
ncbi:MAG: insulinase family protein [Parcubacteria group bacterium]|nr:insulinase family protein [Parcubacteria group bacterium]